MHVAVEIVQAFEPGCRARQLLDPAQLPAVRDRAIESVVKALFQRLGLRFHEESQVGGEELLDDVRVIWLGCCESSKDCSLVAQHL